MRKSLWLVGLLLAAAAALLAGCGGASAGPAVTLNMAAVSAMPPAVQAAPKAVLEAYQFNVANPEIMRQMPCYCGCGSIGHDSNYACYVQDVAADGRVQFDGHALGCGICVDITHDVMRGVLDGKDLQTIRWDVDTKYSRFGPSTPTEPVQ